MNQECQDVADQQTFAEGDPQHLVFAQTKACLIRLINVLCHSRTEQVCFAFFDVLDVLPIHPSCPQPTSDAQPSSFGQVGAQRLHHFIFLHQHGASSVIVAAHWQQKNPTKGWASLEWSQGDSNS